MFLIALLISAFSLDQARLIDSCLDWIACLASFCSSSGSLERSGIDAFSCCNSARSLVRYCSACWLTSFFALLICDVIWLRCLL